MIVFLDPGLVLLAVNVKFNGGRHNQCLPKLSPRYWVALDRFMVGLGQRGGSNSGTYHVSSHHAKTSIVASRTEPLHIHPPFKHHLTAVKATNPQPKSLIVIFLWGNLAFDIHALQALLDERCQKRGTKGGVKPRKMGGVATSRLRLRLFVCVCVCVCVTTSIMKTTA